MYTNLKKRDAPIIVTLLITNVCEMKSLRKLLNIYVNYGQKSKI